MIIILITFSCFVLLKSQLNSCDKTCGGTTMHDCTDYNLPTNNPKNCKSCAPGYIGAAPNGDYCIQGTCHPACSACQDESNEKCYLCSPGYFDQYSDRTRATPCIPCDETCLTCNGPGHNNCLVCNDGYFDLLNNPYSAGVCYPCDTSCAHCEGSATNCVGGCALGYKWNPDNLNTCILGSNKLTFNFFCLVSIILVVINI